MSTRRECRVLRALSKDCCGFVVIATTGHVNTAFLMSMMFGISWFPVFRDFCGFTVAWIPVLVSGLSVTAILDKGFQLCADWPLWVTVTYDWLSAIWRHQMKHHHQSATTEVRERWTDGRVFFTTELITLIVRLRRTVVNYLISSRSSLVLITCLKQRPLPGKRVRPSRFAVKLK